MAANLLKVFPVRSVGIVYLLIACFGPQARSENVALGARVEASSQFNSYKPEYAVDGVLSDRSKRWLNAKQDNHPWIRIQFDSPRRIRAVRVIFDQTGGRSAINSSFQIEDFRAGKTQNILGRIDRNHQIGPYIQFQPVTTDQVRVYWLRNGNLENINRIREIEVFDDKEDLSHLEQASYPYSELHLYSDIRQLAIVYRLGELGPAQDEELTWAVLSGETGETVVEQQQLRLPAGQTKVKTHFDLWWLAAGTYRLKTSHRDDEGRLIKATTDLFELPDYRPYSRPTEPVVVDHKHQLFVDRYLIAEMSGLQRRMHQLEYYEGNPVLAPTEPWEHNRNQSGSVYYFRDDGLFKMWYMTWASRDARPPNALFPIREAGTLCYAVSKDDIHWERPHLGLVEFRGSKENNILMLTDGSHFDSVNVMHTPRDQERPYKTMAFQGRWPYERDKILKVWGSEDVFRIKQHGHFAYYSQDGIHWKLYSKGPVVKAGDRSAFSYYPSQDLYVGFLKTSYTFPTTLQPQRAQKFAHGNELDQLRPTDEWVMHSDLLDPEGGESEGLLDLSTRAFLWGWQNDVPSTCATASRWGFSCSSWSAATVVIGTVRSGSHFCPFPMTLQHGYTMATSFFPHLRCAEGMNSGSISQATHPSCGRIDIALSAPYVWGHCAWTAGFQWKLAARWEQSRQCHLS